MTTKEAAKLGGNAYARGVTCAPCLDRAFMKEIAGQGNPAALMQAWTTAWNASNLKPIRTLSIGYTFRHAGARWRVLSITMGTDQAMLPAPMQVNGAAWYTCGTTRGTTRVTRLFSPDEIPNGGEQ